MFGIHAHVIMETGETAAILKLPWKWQGIFKVTHLTKWDFFSLSVAGFKGMLV